MSHAKCKTVIVWGANIVEVYPVNSGLRFTHNQKAEGQEILIAWFRKWAFLEIVMITSPVKTRALKRISN